MTKRQFTSLRGKIHVKHGFPFKGKHFKSSGPYVVLTPGNFYEEGGFNRNAAKDKCYSELFPEEYLLMKGDILVAMTEQTDGLLGSMAKIPESDRFLHNQRLGLVTPLTRDVDVEFLYHLFRTKSVREQVSAGASGSKVKHTSPERIYDVQVQLPSPHEQTAIAKLLSALDAKVELNCCISKELEGMAKLLYDYWFVQCDFPTTGVQAAAMGKPRLEGSPYRASGGKMIYNEALKRKIPKGWQHSTIGETFKTYSGGTPSREKGEYWTPGEVNWLSSGENPSTFVVDPDERISNLGLQNSPAKLLPEGTVILSLVRHLRASILGIEAATNQSVVGIVENRAFKHCFIYPYLVREIPRLMILRTGAQQPHINKGVLDASLIVVPDESTLEAYTNLANPMFLQIKNHQQQNRELTELRDWLLPMLMNGQVTVG